MAVTTARLAAPRPRRHSHIEWLRGFRIVTCAVDFHSRGRGEMNAAGFLHCSYAFDMKTLPYSPFTASDDIHSLLTAPGGGADHRRSAGCGTPPCSAAVSSGSVIHALNTGTPRHADGPSSRAAHASTA